MAGMGSEQLRLVPGDADFALKPDILSQMIKEDKAKGNIPCFVCATVGTTSSTAIDPIKDIATICQKENLWLHVDAALAGTAAILPEMRWLMDGVDQADSFLFNPHKWMFTNFDCTAYFCKDPDALKKAMAISPEYLKWSKDEAAVNFRDWGVQLGRKFRALKLWFVMRSYGVEGLQKKIRLHLEMTQWFAEKVRAHKSTQLLVEPKINTVCFHLDDDESTEKLMNKINASGQAFLSHTKLNNLYVIRVAFGQTQSTMDSAYKLWNLISSLL